MIIRNLAGLDGKAWHYGELKASGFRGATHICVECGNYLTSAQISVVENTRFCGVCGGQRVRAIPTSQVIY